MAQNCSFGKDELPDLVYLPLKTLSVISTDSGISDTLRSFLDQSYYYEGYSSDILALVNALETTEATFYSIKATAGENVFEWTSNNPETYSLKLSEQTYSHHAYIGRYLRFQKHIPAKGSAVYGTTFSCRANRSQEKYSKDLICLIGSVFCEASVVVLTDGPSEELAKLCSSWVQKEPLLETVEISSHTDLSPLTANTIDLDDIVSFYEYLALLHHNAYPDYSNSHVAATNSYQLELKGGDIKVPLKLYLVSVSDINPHVLHSLLRCETCLSTHATTGLESFLSLYNGEHLFTWKVSR